MDDDDVIILMMCFSVQGSPFTVNVQTVKPHTGVFHCCSFCSSHGSKQVSCGCGGRMSGMEKNEINDKKKEKQLENSESFAFS